MITRVDGVAHLGRLLQEQPMPSEMNKEFHYDERSVNKSFRVLTRVLMQAMRVESFVIEFMSCKEWVDRLLQALEEYHEEEVALTIVRTLKLIFRSEAGHTMCREKFPSMAEFLLMTCTQYPNAPNIKFEAILTLEVLFRFSHFAKLIKPTWQHILAAIRRDPAMS